MDSHCGDAARRRVARGDPGHRAAAGATSVPDVEVLRHGAARADAGTGQSDLTHRDPAPGQRSGSELIVQLPVNVSLAGGVKIEADGKDRGLSIPFTRCVPAGCLAETPLKEEEMRRFRAETRPGKLVYKNAADQPITIPLSFKGFGQ